LTAKNGESIENIKKKQIKLDTETLNKLLEQKMTTQIYNIQSKTTAGIIQR
jgi:hypothetical protein